jgi:hypothetical protein
LLTCACALTQVKRMRNPRGVEDFMLSLLHEMAAVCSRTLSRYPKRSDKGITM